MTNSINYMSCPTSSHLKCLGMGQMFRFENDIKEQNVYMVTGDNPYTSFSIQCLYLKTGQLYNLDPETKVVPINDPVVITPEY